jgi:hypothetical protein
MDLKSSGLFFLRFSFPGCGQIHHEFSEWRKNSSRQMIQSGVKFMG